MTINNNPVSRKPRAKSGTSPSPIKKYEPIRRNSESGSWSLWVLVVILALILVAILVFVFVLPPKSGDNQNKSAISTSTDYSVPMDADSDASKQQDPTALWLTYDKASTTYIFKYPKEWTLRDQGQSLALTLPMATSSEINFYIQSSTKPLAEFLADLDKVSATSYEGKPALQVISSTPFVSGDVKGVQRRQIILAAGLEQEIVYLSYNNKVFAIALNSPKITSELEAAYGLFLSTFKLTPATVATGTSSTLPTSTPPVKEKSTLYSNTKFKFQVDYGTTLDSKQSADGITITNGKYKLIITGVKGAVPALIKYQPNGAKISGQVTIAGKDAVKLLAPNPANSDSPYIQYVLPIDDNSWIKIEYFGKGDVAKLFEEIIATLKFIK
ncbi:MAG: hypothetical protein WC244_03445 [Patescibacteria group bacterium]|jgi:hypothetical protein